ncbi:MAG: DUF3108 domain-containing protein [Actinomycetota bacterium]
MGETKRWMAMAAVLAGVAAGPAAAEPVGYRYDIYWGGLHAGDLALTRDETGAHYRSDMAISTAGLFDLLLRLRFAAESSGRIGPRPLPDHYQTHSRSRREERLLRLSFDPAGEPGAVDDRLLAVFQPHDDDEPAAPVPPAMQQGTLDPLTNIDQVGRGVRAALAGRGPDRFTVASWDGRRRYDFAVTVHAPHRIHMGERDYDTVAIAMEMIPLGGFKPKFLKMWEGAAYQVDLDPATMLPLRIASESFGAALVISATAPCTVPAAQCREQMAAR